jgi:hypothetical protein
MGPAYTRRYIPASLIFLLGPSFPTGLYIRFFFFLFRFLHAISMGGNVGKLVFTYV